MRNAKLLLWATLFMAVPGWTVLPIMGQTAVQKGEQAKPGQPSAPVLKGVVDISDELPKRGEGEEEYEAKIKALADKYKGKIVSVIGKAHSKGPLSLQLIMSNGSAINLLRFKALKEDKLCRVEGVVVLMPANNTNNILYIKALSDQEKAKLTKGSVPDTSDDAAETKKGVDITDLVPLGSDADHDKQAKALLEKYGGKLVTVTGKFHCQLLSDSKGVRAGYGCWLTTPKNNSVISIISKQNGIIGSNSETPKEMRDKTVRVTGMLMKNAQRVDSYDIYLSVTELSVLKLTPDDEFLALVKKVDGKNVTFTKWSLGKKGVINGDQTTLKTTAGLKVTQKTLNKETKKAEIIPVEGGLENAAFSRASVLVRIVVDSNNNITEIRLMSSGLPQPPKGDM